MINAMETGRLVVSQAAAIFINSGLSTWNYSNTSFSNICSTSYLYYQYFLSNLAHFFRTYLQIILYNIIFKNITASIAIEIVRICINLYCYVFSAQKIWSFVPCIMEKESVCIMKLDKLFEILLCSSQLVSEQKSYDDNTSSATNCPWSIARLEKHFSFTKSNPSSPISLSISEIIKSMDATLTNALYASTKLPNYPPSTYYTYGYLVTCSLCLRNEFLFFKLSHKGFLFVMRI